MKVDGTFICFLVQIKIDLSARYFVNMFGKLTLAIKNCERTFLKNIYEILKNG